MKKIFLNFSLCLVLISCSISHNIPASQQPNNTVKPNIINAFVDQNGSFYPDQWKTSYGVPPKNSKKNEYSLKKRSIELGIEQQLQEFQKANLKRVSSQVSPKKRVFIMIHGFNAPYTETTAIYDQIIAQLNANSITDEMIKFYWDGLYSNSLFGGMKNWFPAASFSQTAGDLGLRGILNTIQGKDIYIISHSRGASVVLSALKSPPFKESFVEETKEAHDIDLNATAPLKENGNRITAIMLAPAVGKIDFQEQTAVKDSMAFMRFSPQLKKMHITINNTDNMLKKVIGFLSKKLTPTNLGYNDDLYKELNMQYDFLEKTDFSGMKSHEFKRYIKNPKFKGILKEYKINK